MQVTGMLHGAKLLQLAGFPVPDILGPDASEEQIKALIERHGEVFVLDDVMETEMDVGTYERLLDQNLSASNFTTNGQILSAVLKKVRSGVYLGSDVQVIPHVVGEV